MSVAPTVTRNSSIQITQLTYLSRVPIVIIYRHQAVFFRESGNFGLWRGAALRQPTRARRCAVSICHSSFIFAHYIKSCPIDNRRPIMKGQNLIYRSGSRRAACRGLRTADSGSFMRRTSKGSCRRRPIDEIWG